VVAELLKVIEKLDPTLGSSGSFFLIALSPPSSKMVRERGLLPLLSPTSCGEHLLAKLHVFLLLVMSSNSSPFHSPCFFLLQGCERVERVRGMNKREGESESE
jgi:hypothetical protein